MASLGWIGMGRIGTKMALLLQRSGHQLTLFDAVPERLAPALAEGARAAASPAELTAGVEAVLLSVTDTEAVEQIVFGPAGIAEAGVAGKLIVDHTSIHPERTPILAARLRGQTGMGWVDAPVSGIPGETLAVFLGGEKADVARVEPWVESYARKMTHMGPIGAGQAAKSCNQAIVCATLVAWAEILGHCRGFGLDPALLLSAVEGGGAESAVRGYFTKELLAGALPAETGRNLLKDLEALRDLVERSGATMPVSQAVGVEFARRFAAGV